MWKFLQKITKNLIVAIPVMMISGFVFGIVFPSQFLKGMIIPFTFLMVYPMMVTLNIQKVFEGGDTKAQVLTQAINFGIVPFVAWLAGLIFFKNQPYMALGLLLAGLVPTSGMTISWTGFARGNVAAAVKMTVIGLTLGSIATPFYVQMLLGAAIEIDFTKVMQQILIIVFLPMGAGFFTRRHLVKKYGQKTFAQTIGPKFPALSTLGVIGIVFIAMALKARGIAASPAMIVYILIPLVLIYTFNYLLSSLVGKYFLPRGDAIALVYGSVMRNLSIALAIAINAFGREGTSAALVVAIAYIIQVQSAAWYVKFTDRIFGPEISKPDKETREEKTLPPETDRTQAPMVANIQKILFATDISATAKFAARYACSIGHRFGASVWVMHVVPDVLEAFSSEAGIRLSSQMDPQEKNRLKRQGEDLALEQVRHRIRETSKKVLQEIPHCPLAEENIIIRTGDPVDEIIAQAEQGGFDLIIMGTHGQDEIEDLLLGSTAQGVIRHSKVPVLVARPVIQAD